jgi:hypothetical protein
MRKLITLLMTLCTTYSFASENFLMFEAGYRHDSLDWSVQTPKHDPQIKVGTDFKDVNILQVGVKGRANIGCNVYARGSFDWGYVLDGTAKNKTRIFATPDQSRDNQAVDASLLLSSCSELNDRFVLDADLAIGYPFYFCDCQASIAPVVGYSFNEQYFEADANSRVILDSCGFDEFLTDAPLYSNNKFISKWYGAFIGLDFKYDPGTCWDTYASLEYHWANNKTKHHNVTGLGIGDCWNRHYNGRGYLFNMGFSYDLDHCWSVGLDFTYRDFTAHRHGSFGHDAASEFLALVNSSSDDSSSSSDSFSDDYKSSNKWRSYFIGLTISKKY